MRCQYEDLSSVELKNDFENILTAGRVFSRNVFVFLRPPKLFKIT